MLVRVYKELRSKIFTRRERMLEEQEAGRHWVVFLGTLWLMLMEIRSVFYRFLILNFSDPTDSFNLLFHPHAEELCTYSYCSHKYLKNKVRIFSLAGFSLIILTSVAGTFLLSIILPLLALRAQEVQWQTVPQKYIYKKENLFTIQDWNRGFFLGTMASSSVQLAPELYQGDGRDGDLTVQGKTVWGTCRNQIFDIESPRVITKEMTCLKIGDEVAILYFKEKRGKKVFSTYATNYVQNARGKVIQLAWPVEPQNETIAFVERVPQYLSVTFSHGGNLINDLDGPIILRAQKILGETHSNIANLAELTSTQKEGAWISPVFPINTDGSVVSKIAWEGQANISSDVRIAIASGNKEDQMYWGNEELVGCLKGSPCNLPEIHLGKKYLQFKVTLLDDGGAPPVVNNLQAIVNNGFVSLPTLVGVLDYQLLGLEWQKMGDDDILIQARGGKTLQDLRQASWCGYNRCLPNDFWGNADNNKKISPTHPLFTTGNRWFQYRIFMQSPGKKIPAKIVRTMKFKLLSIPRDLSARN